MTTQTIAHWMKSEHERLRTLSAMLQEKVAVVPRANHARWIGELKSGFAEFRAAVVKHQRLEEEGGYMTGVLEERPSLAAEVERLSHEHVEMRKIMCEIEDSLGGMGANDNLLIRDACRRIQNLLLYLENHAKHEDLLAVSVFMDDGGAED